MEEITVNLSLPGLSPRVFISYSHDSDDHKRRVLELSDRLRDHNVDCYIDQYETSPPEGWPLWMIRQVTSADYVLVVCTESYHRRFLREELPGKGLGSTWEGAIITLELYEAQEGNSKFIPIYFDDDARRHIPIILRGATSYPTGTEKGFWDVFRHVTNQVLVTKPPLGNAFAAAPYGGLTLTFSDEERIKELLNTNLRKSRARCIRLWQAAGVPYQIACDLVEDEDICSPKGMFPEGLSNPVTLVLGDFGTGKSLLAERLYQQAIRARILDPKTPFPVHLRAPDVHSTLEASITNHLTGLGFPDETGILLIVDGAEETGSGRATDLLDEARFIINSWPSTQIILTSRAIPTLASAEERINMPLLSDGESRKIASIISGTNVSQYVHSWPDAVKDAIKRPFFALLIGRYLRDRDWRMPESTGDLLHHLVETSLYRVRLEKDSTVWQDLLRLAVLSTDRSGAPVPISEFEPMSDLASLLATGLVTSESGACGFPLPILNQWFAAHSLAADIVSADQLISDLTRLSRWRYALIIFVRTFAHYRVTSVMSRLAEACPGIAGALVHEALTPWSLVDSTGLPPGSECGTRIHQAMAAWSKGLGPLGLLIAPVLSNGRLRSLGVRTSGNRLMTSWYHGPDDLPDVIDLPPREETFEYAVQWPSIRSTSISSRQSAWAWRLTFDGLVQDLSKVLQQKDLHATTGIMARECSWRTARLLTDQRSWLVDSIRVDDIESALQRIPTHVQDVYDGSRMYSDRKYHLNCLRQEIAHLRIVGATHLLAPLPLADTLPRDGESTFTWNFFTDRRLEEHVRAVMEGALEGYQALVNTWFLPLAPWLRTYVLLPSKVCVRLMLPQRDKAGAGQHSLQYWFEPQPPGSKSLVELRLVDEWMDLEEEHRLFDDLRSRHIYLRPVAADWIHATIHGGGADLHSGSVTNLIYQWLWSDLEDISWVSGMRNLDPFD